MHHIIVGVLTGLEYDKDCKARDSQPDIGAYEVRLSCIAPSLSHLPRDPFSFDMDVDRIDGGLGKHLLNWKGCCREPSASSGDDGRFAHRVGECFGSSLPDYFISRRRLFPIALKETVQKSFIEGTRFLKSVYIESFIRKNLLRDKKWCEEAKLQN